MYKRLFGIILAALMLFSLVACNIGGNNKPSNVKPSNTVISELEVNNDELENKAEEKEETIETKVDSKLQEFSMGSWNGNTYSNSFLGLKFDMPKGWVRYSDEQIDQLINAGFEIMDGSTEQLKKVAELTSVYYLIAQDPNSGNSVQIMTEKPLQVVSMDYYVSSLTTMLESQTALNYTIKGVKDFKLAGEDFKAVETVSTVNGLSAVQTIYIRKLGDYFISVIATDRNNTVDINSMVSSL